MTIEIINLNTGAIFFTAKNSMDVQVQANKPHNIKKLEDSGLCGLEIGVKRCVSPNGKYTILPLTGYLNL